MITFTNDSSQKFSTTINGKLYFFEVSYNTITDKWIMDINDNNIFIYGVVIVSGIDILKQFCLGFGLISMQEDPSRDSIINYTLKVI